MKIVDLDRNVTVQLTPSLGPDAPATCPWLREAETEIEIEMELEMQMAMVVFEALGASCVSLIVCILCSIGHVGIQYPS